MMPTASPNESAPTAVLSQPVLETPRLRLRPFVAADGPDVERLAGDRAIADTTQNIPYPYPAGAGAAWIASLPGIWEAGNGVTFAITDRESGALIGGIGLAITRISASAELGYWIAVPHWGRGYATEASRAVLALGFDMGVHRVQARHLTRNPASGRVMVKLGMTFEGVLREAATKWGRFEDVALYAVLEREFLRG
jgi:RimJ/RimL family protein N-acetyltransferase